MIMAEIRLRAPEPEDVDRLYIWENDPEGGLHGHWAHAPLSRFQIWEYVNNYDADPSTSGAVRMMIESGAETLGTVDLYDIDLYNRRASVGIYIDHNCRGKGIGSSAIDAIETYAADMLGLHTLLAYCVCENSLSCHVFESHGFMPAGILKDNVRIGRRYCDVEILQKVL